jgi:hypothetical protein
MDAAKVLPSEIAESMPRRHLEKQIAAQFL